MARLLWAVRQNRNYPIVAVLLLLITIDVLTLCGVVHSNDAWNAQASGRRVAGAGDDHADR
ncbi:MAG: hypothetical protein R3E67_01120 [Pseudomonadales bacterium]